MKTVFKAVVSLFAFALVTSFAVHTVFAYVGGCPPLPMEVHMQP